MQDENHKVQPSEHQLLRELQELTSRQYVYEDLWCGMVPFNGELGELQTGPPVAFADLTWREQADVLREFIQWDRYPERAWNDEYTIRENIEAGLSPEAWLKGTSLSQSFQHLADGKTPPPVQREPELTWEDLSKLHFSPDHPEAANAGGPDQTPAPAGENPGRQDASPATLKDQLFGATLSAPAPQPEHSHERQQSLHAELFGESVPGRKETAANMVHFKGFLCEMQWTTYTNGRPALYLIEATTRETVAVATANLPDAALKPGEVFIKDHSENQGMLAALEQAGVVKATGRAVPSGFVEVPVAELLPRQGREADRPSPNPDSTRQRAEAEPKPQPGHTHERQHKR